MTLETGSRVCPPDGPVHVCPSVRSAKAKALLVDPEALRAAQQT